MRGRKERTRKYMNKCKVENSAKTSNTRKVNEKTEVYAGTLSIFKVKLDEVGRSFS